MLLKISILLQTLETFISVFIKTSVRQNRLFRAEANASLCHQVNGIRRQWSSLVEGGKGSFMPNCQTNLVIARCMLSLLFCKFINTTAYHLGRYEPSSP